MREYTKEIYFKDGFQVKERIYVLKNPMTNEIFYIGRTKKPLSDRLHGHISAAKGKSDKFTNAIKDAYIRDLIKSGVKPKIGGIETIIPISYIEYLEIAEREIYWMRHFQEKGCLIMNIIGLRISQPNAKYLWYLEMKRKKSVPNEYYFCGTDIAGVNLYDKERLLSDGMYWYEDAKEYTERYNPYNNWRWKLKVGLQ